MCMLIIDRPSETIVPEPMLHRNGLSWRWLVPMFEPVCSTLFRFQPTLRMQVVMNVESPNSTQKNSELLVRRMMLCIR